MKTRTIPVAAAVAALCVCGLPRAGALDFVVHTMTVEEDGFTKEVAYVGNDARTNVLLMLPARWNRVDSAASLTLTPPDINNSLVRLEKSSLAPDTPFADKGLDTYRRRAQTGVPQGVTGLQCVQENDNPLPIFGWKDHEFIFTYDFFGQAYKRGVLFVDLNAREQIMLTCVAPADQFDRVRGAGLDVLRSWQVVAAK